MIMCSWGDSTFVGGPSMTTHMDLGIIEAADVTSLSREDQAAAIFKGTCSLSQFAESQVCPVIMGQLAKSDYEQAIAGTFYRLALLVRGLGRLDDPCHFQLANSTAPTVFELLLDIKALASDHTLAAKFLAFTRVSRFHKATQLTRFLSENPAVDRSSHLQAIQFADDPIRRQEVEQLCIQHWGSDSRGRPLWPEHWSGLSIADRAQRAGLDYEEIYRSQFFLQSYSIHAGGAGVDGISRDGLICSFGIAHSLVQQMFAEAISIIADGFHLFQADTHLRERLHRVSAASGFFAVQAVLERHGKPENEEP